MNVLRLFITWLCLCISGICSVPLQLQLLSPYQRIQMQPQENLQQQLLELQAMQQLNSIAAPIALNNPLPPLLLSLRTDQTNTNINEIQKIDKNNESKLKLRDMNTKLKDEDLDSVVVDAEPVPIIEEQKAILVLPNARLSLGDFISAIPFLPIEINVPDTIAWAYNGIANGISGIISIIGQRLPFQRPLTNEATKGISLKSMINDLQVKNEHKNIINPFIMIPLERFNRPVIPIQL